MPLTCRQALTIIPNTKKNTHFFSEQQALGSHIIFANNTSSHVSHVYIMLPTSSSSPEQRFLAVYSRNIGMNATWDLIVQLITQRENFLVSCMETTGQTKRSWGLENFINLSCKSSLVPHSPKWLKMNQQNLIKYICQKSLFLVPWQCIILSHILSSISIMLPWHSCMDESGSCLNH